jgi:hypothetical protein
MQLLWALYSTKTARRVKSGAAVAGLTSGLAGRKAGITVGRGELRKDASAIAAYRELQYYRYTQ